MNRIRLWCKWIPRLKRVNWRRTTHPCEFGEFWLHDWGFRHQASKLPRRTRQIDDIRSQKQSKYLHWPDRRKVRFVHRCHQSTPQFHNKNTALIKTLLGPLHMSPVPGRILWCVHMGNFSQIDQDEFKKHNHSSRLSELYGPSAMGPCNVIAGPREARNPNLDSDQRIAYYACAPGL